MGFGCLCEIRGFVVGDTVYANDKFRGNGVNYHVVSVFLGTFHFRFNFFYLVKFNKLIFLI